MEKEIGLKNLQTKNVSENYEVLKKEHIDVSEKYSEKIGQLKEAKVRLINTEESLKKL